MLVKSLIRSISDTRFYSQLADRSVFSAVAFFTIFTTITSSFSGYRFITQTLPGLADQANQDLELIKETYPVTYQVTWDGAKLAANFTQPLIFDYPAVFGEPVERLPKVFLTYVPAEGDPGNLAQNLEQSTYLLLSNTSLAFTDFNGGWSTTALPDLLTDHTSFAITKDSFDSYIVAQQEQLRQVLSSAQPVIFGSYVFLGYLSQLLMTIVYTAMTLFMTTIYKLNLSFAHLLKISLHLMVLAQVLDLLIRLLYPSLDWSMLSLSFWSMMVFVVISLQHTSVFYRLS